MSRIVAIHQPNFLPWLGYFNKIARADVFIVLDNVQFSKTGGTWTNRVRLAIQDQAKWVTVPIVRSYHGLRLISEMRISEGPWRARLLRTVQNAYGGAPHAAVVFPLVERLVSNPTDVLVDYNVSAIRSLLLAFKLERAELVMASSLGATGHGTDLLVDLVKAVAGTAYLCGGGASGYQEDERFARAGIELVYQDFRHPVYRQGRDRFMAGLSIVDTLMHCGFDETRTLLLGQTRRAPQEELGHASLEASSGGA